MSKEVWVVGGIAHRERYESLIAMGDVWDEEQGQDSDRFERAKRHRAGEILPEDLRPRQVYRSPIHARRKGSKLPNFSSSGLHYVSSEAADVMQQFDVGKVQFDRQETYEKDKKTRCKTDMMLFSVGNIKDSFLPKESPDFLNLLPQISRLQAHPLFTYRTEDDFVALGQAAVTGPDVWIEKNVRGAIFMSGKMAQALRDIGLDKEFHFIRARVVSGLQNNTHSKEMAL